MGWKVINRVQRSAPQILLRQDFINDLYEDFFPEYRIAISNTCRTALEDYNLVKQGPDGKMAKEKVKDPLTQQRYEKYGHFSDAKVYFVTTILADLLLNYKKSSPPA